MGQTRYWWANQKTRWRRPEREMGHVFAPLPDSSTNYQRGWENVRHLKPGHVIVHNVRSRLLAVSRVIEGPTQAQRPTLPDETAAEKDVAGYRVRGNLVKVDYFDLHPPIAVNTIPPNWRTSKYGPFSDAIKTSGRPEQIYLDVLSPDFVEMLRRTFEDQWPDGY